MLKVNTLHKLLSGLSREDRIRAALFMLGMSQREAADRLDGVSYTTVRMYLGRQVDTDREPVLRKLEAFIESEIGARIS